MKIAINKISLELVSGDILLLPVQAVVTATDTNLTPSPELIATAGEELRHETAQIGWCDVGSAVVTGSGRLPHARHVIHAVAPRWGEGTERGKLANVTWECLWLAESIHVDSIALPAISVGTPGYPVEACAQIMISRVIDFTFESTKSLRHIVLCLADHLVFSSFATEFQRQIDQMRQSGEGSVFD